jgi:hypothetical protein
MCGGIGAKGDPSKAATDPSLCCPLESSCVKYNDWFWQCQPEGYEPEPFAAPKYDETCAGTKVSICWGTSSLAEGTDSVSAHLRLGENARYPEPLCLQPEEGRAQHASRLPLAS